MRIGRVEGRPALIRDDSWVDVAAASGGRFRTDDSIFAGWREFVEWAGAFDVGGDGDGVGKSPAGGDGVGEPLAGNDGDGVGRPLARARLEAPRPAPRQVFGAGLNYHGHLAETGREVPALPLMFTKFPTSICGPDDDVELATGMVDFEAELVVVIGERADRIPAERAWSHVAGLTVGQDVSARDVQRSGQLSIAKSFRTFAPIGPWISTIDEVADPDDLAIRCTLNGEVVQDARTSDMVFGVAELVALLSAVTPLLPGDLVFTGTPAGVGVSREPAVFLRPGDELTTEIEGVGVLRNRCVAVESPNDAQRRWADARKERTQG